METAIAIIVGALIVLGLAALGFFLAQRYKSQRLRSKFGPEYSRAVEEAGGKAQEAEARLARRAERVERYHIHPLTAAETEHYRTNWRGVQTDFVDDPKGAIAAADELLTEVMSARGYPVGDFERQSADLSVDHPVVVQNYRMAHDIAVRHARGEASTEDLRQAILCYKALFRELVGEHEKETAED